MFVDVLLRAFEMFIDASLRDVLLRDCFLRDVLLIDEEDHMVELMKNVFFITKTLLSRTSLDDSHSTSFFALGY